MAMRTGASLLLERLLSWLGLNTASLAGAPGDLLVNPVVGVRCQAVEARVAQGRGERLQSYVPPTTSEPLRYLVPVEDRRERVFESSPRGWRRRSEPRVDLVGHVDAVGFELCLRHSEDVLRCGRRRCCALDSDPDRAVQQFGIVAREPAVEDELGVGVELGLQQCDVVECPGAFLHDH